MRKLLFLSLILLSIAACTLQETRRGVGNEGFLVLQVTPEDAEVFMDGERVGTAGQFAKSPLELKSGTHKVELRRTGYAAEIRDVYVGNQSRNTLKVNLKKF